MTRYPLTLALLALLLLSPACRHRHARPDYSQEEAQPVSELPHAEFSHVSPQRRGR